jgi:hypothetical protein
MSTRSKAKAVDIERILTELESAPNDVRVTFLCILAHDLTVSIRAALLDRPVRDTDADRAYRVNEWLHQLTSCVNPVQRRSPVGDADLVRGIVESAAVWGLQSAVQHGIAIAAGNSLTHERKIVAAQ